MAADHFSIEQRVFLKANPARVWQAMTDKIEFEQWFRVRLEGELVGGTTVVMRGPDENDSNWTFPVDVVEIDEGRSMVWHWHPGEHEQNVDYTLEPKTTVVLSIEPHLDGTMLTVSETGFEAIATRRLPGILRDNINGWLDQVVSFRNYLRDAA